MSVKDAVLRQIERATGARFEAIRYADKLSDLGSSLEIVEIAMELEEKLGIEIPEGPLRQCTTVGDLIGLVERCGKLVGIE